MPNVPHPVPAKSSFSQPPLRVIVLHGFTRNGQDMRQKLAPLVAKLPQDTVVDFPDGPLQCTEEQVTRNYRLWRAPIPDGPHKCWWNASEDGLIYDGLDQSVKTLRQLVSEPTDSDRTGTAANHSQTSLGIIGFSQGAIFAAILAALSRAGQFPALRFAVFIAGAPPRAECLQHYFSAPLSLPTLHIWGVRDPMARKHCPALFDLCNPTSSHRVKWSGNHSIPRDEQTVNHVARFIQTAPRADHG